MIREAFCGTLCERLNGGLPLKNNIDLRMQIIFEPVTRHGGHFVIRDLYHLQNSMYGIAPNHHDSCVLNIACAGAAE